MDNNSSSTDAGFEWIHDNRLLRVYKCDDCDGKGRIQVDGFFKTSVQSCSNCDGTGEVVKEIPMIKATRDPIEVFIRFVLIYVPPALLVFIFLTRMFGY